MEKFFVLLTAASLVSGIQYNGLRVKYGSSDALADKEYFFKIPRTISEAEAECWERTQRPPGPLNELRMYCPPRRIICALYDADGFVAGLQIAFPVHEFYSGPVVPEKFFVKWVTHATKLNPAMQYWTATQFFVSKESLDAGAGPTVKNGATLQDGGVWVYGPDGRLMRIPSTEAELSSTAYKKQNCIPNMGTHYYYNMTAELSCEELFPWAALVTQGELVGTVFQTFGKMVEYDEEIRWFESLIAPPIRGINPTIPSTPKCFKSWVVQHGFNTMHIYYVNEPWNIKCSDGDSADPAAPMDRLLFSVYRYASKISDEFKNLFSR